MESMRLPSIFIFFLFLFFASFFWVFPYMAMAEATTDPLESLNRVFRQWTLAAPPNEWNISEEPCSRVALSTTSINEADEKPCIICDCSYDNGSTCHITELMLMQHKWKCVLRGFNSMV
ncbi:hypothetical protein BT93_J1031 [Corymbia citriodora subsp. variegata]|nr:hypothetical protein BT93_J1031 [Corymbia citriodora subsp. variegata]